MLWTLQFLNSLPISLDFPLNLFDLLSLSGGIDGGHPSVLLNLDIEFLDAIADLLLCCQMELLIQRTLLVLVAQLVVLG